MSFGVSCHLAFHVIWRFIVIIVIIVTKVLTLMLKLLSRTGVSSKSGRCCCCRCIVIGRYGYKSSFGANKTPWFPLMWMVRFVTFVHKDLCQGTNPCEQKWQIWPSTSTGTMVFCWSCKQSWSWSNANPPVAGQGLTRSQNSCRIEFSSKNGREISSSLYGTTRCGQLYIARSHITPI